MVIAYRSSIFERVLSPTLEVYYEQEKLAILWKWENKAGENLDVQQNDQQHAHEELAEQDKNVLLHIADTEIQVLLLHCGTVTTLRRHCYWYYTLYIGILMDPLSVLVNLAFLRAARLLLRKPISPTGQFSWQATLILLL